MSILKNVRAYLPKCGIVRADIEYENGVITAVREADGSAPSSLPEGSLVIPGMIDQHIHALEGVDTMDSTAAALDTMSCALAKEGTTAFLATTLTQSKEALCEALSAAREYVEKGNFSGAELIGVHLEGPFISPKFIGAQNPDFIQRPDAERFDEYQRAAGGLIRIVSLAPELEGADALIEHLSKNGVSPSAGHTAAGYEDMVRAVKHGLASVTHTYNAQSGVHHREIGVVGAAMLCDELYAELICDTVHVSVPALKLMIRNKPANKVILITDSIRPKGLPDGEFDSGGLTVYLKNGEARLANGALAGSTLRMNYALRNLVEKVGVPLENAIDFATVNPATHLGLAHERGTIEVGKRADFAILNEQFDVLSTIVGGVTVYKI
ncbi:MAG: N-acetylglucosamine-6-phosphate deacetylase [Clostridia bacterium]|nr:N-acetylglucosamine-6-phosphate deacetylase [Clostridia bacterium]